MRAGCPRSQHRRSFGADASPRNPRPRGLVSLTYSTGAPAPAHWRGRGPKGEHFALLFVSRRIRLPGYVSHFVKTPRQHLPFFHFDLTMEKGGVDIQQLKDSPL